MIETRENGRPHRMSDNLTDKLNQIARAIALGSYRYTVHGARQRIARSICENEVEEVIGSGEIIEDYPNHRYGPACLILGRTITGKMLHVLCSCRSVVDIITVYEPDSTEWSADFKTRR